MTYNKNVAICFQLLAIFNEIKISVSICKARGDFIYSN